MDFTGRVLLVGLAEGRDFVDRRLAPFGWDVVTADGRPVVDQLADSKADVLLLGLDCDQPATETVRQCKTTDSCKDVPILLLAATPELGVVQQCIDLGAEDFLILPISPALLQRFLRDYMQLRLDRQAERERAQERHRLRLERDMDIARDIQLNFLPTALPQPAGWELAAKFDPALDVSGDWYDAFTIVPDRGIGVVVADVADKGVGAALFMFLARSLLRAFAQQSCSLNLPLIQVVASQDQPPLEPDGTVPAATAALFNSTVQTNTYITTTHRQLNMFATVFFGVFDPLTGTLDYINAGHCPPVIIGAAGDIKSQLEPSGPAVGLWDDANFQVRRVALEPGDILFAYSDGATDARDPSGERLTVERLHALVGEPAAGATHLLDKVTSRIRSHIDTADAYDDITLLALHRKPIQ